MVSRGAVPIDVIMRQVKQDAFEFGVDNPDVVDYFFGRRDRMKRVGWACRQDQVTN